MAEYHFSLTFRKLNISFIASAPFKILGIIHDFAFLLKFHRRAAYEL